MPGFNRRISGGIRFEKGMDEKGYYLTAQIGGMAPEDLLIKPMHGSLMISSTQMSQSETRDQTAGRSYRFSRSFGNFSRRISLPFDADIENMERTDSDGAVTLFIPRLVEPGQRPGSRPGYVPQPNQLPYPGFSQGPGPSMQPPSEFDDQSQYPIPDPVPDQAPTTGDTPAADPYGSVQNQGSATGYLPGPGFGQGYPETYPQQPGFAPPYGYGAYQSSRAPYGQYQLPTPGQMPFFNVPPADPGSQAGSCSCPCPCPENRSSTENRE